MSKILRALGHPVSKLATAGLMGMLTFSGMKHYTNYCEKSMGASPQIVSAESGALNAIPDVCGAVVGGGTALALFRRRINFALDRLTNS